MDAALLDALSPLARLALAYAPAPLKPKWLGLLALDARLDAIVRQAREPVLAQIRLAWWRERLAEGPDQRPRGEPLLAGIADWPDAGRCLAPLADGWEALLGEGEGRVGEFAAGRAAACCALAATIGADPGIAGALAERWSLAECALRPEDDTVTRDTLRRLRATAPVPAAGRALAPLLVVERIAVRAASKQDRAALTSPVALLQALRAGLLGR